MSIINKNLFEEISAPSIQRYLISKGWKQDHNFKNKNLMVFNSEDKKLKIAIPADEHFEDFFIVLHSVLETISIYENRSIKEIIKEILTVYFDRLEFRIISKESQYGKLPLEYASECIRGLKDLVLYATCAEMDAKPICSRATKQAIESVRNFNLAQTEHGSFIINIDVRVIDEHNEQMTLDPSLPESPFQHKVVRRINSAIHQLDQIVNNEKQLTEVAETAYQTGITANMCDALLCLKPKSGSTEIDTTIRYASALTKTLVENDRIIIRDNHFYAMDQLSKIYRNKVLYQDVILRGIIKSLSMNDRDDDIERTIRLLTIYNGQYRVIIMDLSGDDYRKACDAHRDEKEIEVAGELDMNNRTYILTKIEYFKTI